MKKTESEAAKGVAAPDGDIELFTSQLFFNLVGHALNRSGSDCPAVDVDGGNAPDLHGSGQLNIGIDLPGDQRIFDVMVIPFHVQAGIHNNLPDFFIVQFVVCLIECFGNCLIFSLPGSGKRCNGCGSGKFVTSQGVMFVYKVDLVGIFLEQLLKCRINPGAVRSLVIGKDHHIDRGIGLAKYLGMTDLDIEHRGDLDN